MEIVRETKKGTLQAFLFFVSMSCGLVPDVQVGDAVTRRTDFQLAVRRSYYTVGHNVTVVVMDFQISVVYAECTCVVVDFVTVVGVHTVTSEYHIRVELAFGQSRF